MKKTTCSVIAIAFAVGVSFFLSCNKEAERTETSSKTAATPENPPSGIVSKSASTLGYLDEKGTFRPIADDWLKDYYREILHLDPDLPLENPEIVGQMNPETGEYVFAVMVFSSDGTYKISTVVEPYSAGHYLLKGSGCTCKAIHCMWSEGCRPMSFGGDCMCSQCDGTCEKTSTVTSNSFIQSFFAVYAL